MPLAPAHQVIHKLGLFCNEVFDGTGTLFRSSMSELLRKPVIGGAAKCSNWHFKNAWFMCFALVVCLAAKCSADNVSGNGQWEPWNPGQASPDIGWCTAGSAGCLVTTPAGTINYYANASGNLGTPSNISFVGSAQFMNISFSFNSAALGAGTDYVGFYMETQAGTIASMIPLFSTASQNSNVLLAVSTGAQYGFYVENVQGEGTASETDEYYFMNTNLNHSNTGSLSADQHFALYNSLATNTYFIGIENPLVTGSNSDFNSMLLTATYPPNTDPTPQAPEPASIVITGASLCAFGCFLRRRRSPP